MVGVIEEVGVERFNHVRPYARTVGFPRYQHDELDHRSRDGAARVPIIDGCNEWQVLIRVVMPTARLAVFAVIVFGVQTHWNEFTDPLVFVNSLNNFPISLGLAMFQGQYGTQYNLLMAASLISMVPLILIFAFFQKYFIEGVVITGVKQ